MNKLVILTIFTTFGLNACQSSSSGINKTYLAWSTIETIYKKLHKITDLKNESIIHKVRRQLYSSDINEVLKCTDIFDELKTEENELYIQEIQDIFSQSICDNLSNIESNDIIEKVCYNIEEEDEEFEQIQSFNTQTDNIFNLDFFIPKTIEFLESLLNKILYRAERALITKLILNLKSLKLNQEFFFNIKNELKKSKIIDVNDKDRLELIYIILFPQSSTLEASYFYMQLFNNKLINKIIDNLKMAKNYVVNDEDLIELNSIIYRVKTNEENYLIDALIILEDSWQHDSCQNNQEIHFYITQAIYYLNVLLFEAEKILKKIKTY